MTHPGATVPCHLTYTHEPHTYLNGSYFAGCTGQPPIRRYNAETMISSITDEARLEALRALDELIAGFGIDGANMRMEEFDTAVATIRRILGGGS